MLSKALELGACFHRGPVWGENGGNVPFLRPPKKRVKFTFIKRTLIDEFERNVKGSFGNRQLFP